jgi:ribonuclease P/MRP protein subunit POP5
MKVLPSSLRRRKRYIVFEVLCEVSIRMEELIKAIWGSSHSLYGDVGMSELDLRLITFDDKRAIIRCARDKIEETRAVLAAIDNVSGHPVGIYVLGISGTIKGAKKRLIQ